MTEAATDLKPTKKAPEPEEEESGKMTFLEHLDDLRKCLVHIAAYVGIGFIACWYWSKQIYHFISIPILNALPSGTRLVYTKVTDIFILYMKVAFIAGIFLTIPLTLYEVWKFIAPALYRKEKRYVLPFLFFSVFLFLLGGAFCYTVVLEQAFSFLVQFGADFAPMITANEYMDMTLMMLVGFGVIFEMPVISAFLSMFGLVTAHFLWSRFKYSLVIIVALAAVLSPTADAFNLLIWTMPMVGLYVVSIGVAWIFGHKRKAKGLV